jgi:hypothetical protein
VNPLFLFFKKNPIFRILPCFAIDDSVVEDIQKIRTVVVSDNTTTYLVFSMNNWTRENDLFYLGKTTLVKKKNTIEINSKLLLARESSDIVFIPENVFYELIWFSNKLVFFPIYPNVPLDNLNTLIEKNKSMVFVHEMNEELTLQRGIAPRKIYFNSGRWEEFFSPYFRELIDMKMVGFDRDLISPVYGVSYHGGEAICFTLPSFRSVKNDSFRLLCKYIYETLFERIEEPEAFFDSLESTDESEQEDETEQKNEQVISPKKISIPKKKIVGLLKGCGWIHILHTV